LKDFHFRLRERFLYKYDLNDQWQHEVRIEQILAVEGSRLYPVCIGGKRAAPPKSAVGWRSTSQTLSDQGTESHGIYPLGA
jgi:Plasmid pRiA4b ORF-3-like protein